MGFYDEAIHRTYRFPAAAVDTAAVFGRFIGPAGKLGRVRGMEFLCTVATTGSDGLMTVGENGATLPAAMTVPALSQFAGIAMTAAQIAAAGADEVAGVNDVELPADTVIECASDGVLGAGDGDIIVSVDWF